MIRQLTKKTFENMHEVSMHSPVFIYFETPLCGTCKMGKRMLEIAVQSLETDKREFFIYECNINEFPALARTYGITSVPCLTVLRRGVSVKQVYAMHSAAHLYELLVKNAH
jgi:thioredoxin-like negative regulator of GroEL